MEKQRVMPAMSAGWWSWVAIPVLAVAAIACGGGDDDPAGAAGSGAAGAAGAPSGGSTGTLQVDAHWNGSIPAGTELKVAVFDCPFSMPPKRVFNGDVDSATGKASATDEKVPVGQWCLMAYYDLDPSDGLAPVEGLDPVNATGNENEKGSLPFVIEGGKTTTVVLELAVSQNK